jgi:hypothetical protein
MSTSAAAYDYSDNNSNNTTTDTLYNVNISEAKTPFPKDTLTDILTECPSDNDTVILWKQGEEPKPITEFEKSMLNGTLNPYELLEQEEKEQREKKEETEDERERRLKKEYIIKVKVIALDKMGKYPLCNPSTFYNKDKQKLMLLMQEIIDKYSEEEITILFNSVCNDIIFTINTDFSKLPVYNL